MAEIDLINRVNPSVSPQQTAAVQPQRTGNVENDVKQSPVTQDDRIRPQEEERQQPELENVVAVSEYGDTVQVSDEGQEKLENGLDEDQDRADEMAAQAAPYLQEGDDRQTRPLEDIQVEITPAKEDKTTVESVDEKRLVDEEEDRDEQAAREKEESVSSYAGYSDSELEQMYLDGEISRYAYETEIGEREEEEAEEAAEEAAKEISEDMREIVRAAQDSERKARAVELAYDNPSQAVSPQERLEAMEKVEKAQEDQQIQQQKEQQTRQQSENINFWVS